MKPNALALILAAILAASLACSYAKTGCKVIHVADKACHVLILQDGTPVEITAEDLDVLGRAAMRRQMSTDAGILSHEAGE